MDIGGSIGGSIGEDILDSMGGDIGGFIGGSIEGDISDSNGGSMGGDISGSNGGSMGGDIGSSFSGSRGADIDGSIGSCKGASIGDSMGADIDGSIGGSMGGYIAEGGMIPGTAVKVGVGREAPRTDFTEGGVGESDHAGPQEVFAVERCWGTAATEGCRRGTDAAGRLRLEGMPWAQTWGSIPRGRNRRAGPKIVVGLSDTASRLDQEGQPHGTERRAPPAGWTEMQVGWGWMMEHSDRPSRVDFRSAGAGRGVN